MATRADRDPVGKRRRDGQTDRQRDSIHVGMTAALTGRYSLPGRQALIGAQAWVEDTNRAGGIWLHDSREQRLLRLTSYDDASDPEQCGILTKRSEDTRLNSSHDQISY